MSMIAKNVVVIRATQNLRSNFPIEFTHHFASDGAPSSPQQTEAKSTNSVFWILKISYA